MAVPPPRGAMGYLARDIRVNKENQEKVLENQAFCWDPVHYRNKIRGWLYRYQARAVSDPRGRLSFHEIQCEVVRIHFIKPDLLQVD